MDSIDHVSLHEGGCEFPNCTHVQEFKELQMAVYLLVTELRRFSADALLQPEGTERFISLKKIVGNIQDKLGRRLKINEG